MNLVWLEQIMYQLSGWFMAPVLLIISLLFLYSLFATGSILAEYFQRRGHRLGYEERKAQALHAQQTSEQNFVESAAENAADEGKVDQSALPGYELFSFYLRNPQVSDDALNVLALKKLEWLLITTKIAPMLGLIATMIPMAPALKALSDGNVQGISENLIIAFSAVIFGMVIASITFVIASVRKRWFATELVDIENVRLKPIPMVTSGSISETAKSEKVREVA